MWRKPTTADIAATLSQAEIDQFRQFADANTSADPVEDILAHTTAMVRGYCRRNAQIRLSTGEDKIPESLMSPAMDYAAYDILKRLRVDVGEDRRRAREQAIALFDKVAKNEVTPESDDDGEDESNRARPGFTHPPWPRTLF